MSDDLDFVDFTPAKYARLRPHDMAILAKVSRVTASMWMNGHAQPHHLHKARVKKLLALISTARQAELLPVPHHVVRRERGLYIQNALIQAAQAQASE